MALHFKYIAADARDRGQSEYEYHHQTACGYVRQEVTNNPIDVNCTHCLSSGRVPKQKNIGNHDTPLEDK